MAHEEKNAEMGFFKRLKLWKRAGNRKTGVLRGILKCLVPCIRQTSRSASPGRSRSPSPERIIMENKTKENCQENVKSPRSVQFDGVCFGETEEVRRREGEALRFRDFEIVKLLGMGSFGKVVLASKKSKGGKSSSEEKLALKIVPHPHMLTVEREFFIEANGHPFVVQLVTSFNTKESVCYVMENLEGGTLLSIGCPDFRDSVSTMRDSTQQKLFWLLNICSHGIVHRDIKPTNILLDRDGHCKLADFGLCEVGMFTWSRTAGFCGTSGYMAPEICKDLLYGAEVDWWSVGCVMQDMMVGMRPRLEVFDRPEYPKILTPDALSILKRFLEPNPLCRLGARGDTRSILTHRFFKTVDWDAVLQKRVTPPVNPLTLTCQTTDPGAHGAADESGSVSFKSALEGASGDVDDNQSTTSFKSAVEWPVLEVIIGT